MKRVVKASEEAESTVIGTCPIHTEEERRLFDRRENYKTPTPRCRICEHANKSSLVGKTRLRPQDKPLRADYDAGYTLTTRPDGTFDPEAGAAFIARIARDEVLLSQVSAMVRRPSGVSKERFGIAQRHAAKEPMLNADPQSLKFLDHDKAVRKGRIPKGLLYKRIVVKPLNGRNARMGRNNSFWGEREWLVHTLRYGRGYILTTDTADESKVFPTYGELASAIRKSGWEILR